MTNADKFKNIFGLYATELWSMSEKDFLKWLNSEVMNCSEIPNKSDTIYRQQAIDAVKTGALSAATIYGRTDEGSTALYETVKAIKALPSAQPELDEWCTDCKEYDTENHCCPRWNRVIRETLKDAQPKITLESAIDYLDSIGWMQEHDRILTESAQAERPKGNWILIADGYTDYVKCDQCGNISYVERNFCSSCGADMRIKETDNDYERAVDQLEHDILYEPTFNQDDGSM